MRVDGLMRMVWAAIAAINRWRAGRLVDRAERLEAKADRAEERAR